MKIARDEKILDSNRLVSEAEACNAAGITLDTLRSYTQFSLLKPIIRNHKPFYRLSELCQLFNFEEKVPTLENLLNEEEEIQEVEKKTIADNLPAIKVEDIMLQNQALNTRVKSLEDERDWLRKRVEMLEERSAREQMLMLKEKETLSDIIHATLIPKQKFSFTDYFKKLALPFFSNSKV